MVAEMTAEIAAEIKNDLAEVAAEIQSDLAEMVAGIQTDLAEMGRPKFVLVIFVIFST